MNPESEIERPLRIRLFVVSCVFLLVCILNIVLNVRGDSVRSQRNDKIAAQDAELQARITEVQSILAEADQLRQQASDLVDKTAKTANGEKPPTSTGGSSVSAKKTP
jgi:cell division protein FtsB